jgi:hypothetical protein
MKLEVTEPKTVGYSMLAAVRPGSDEYVAVFYHFAYCRRSLLILLLGPC